MRKFEKLVIALLVVVAIELGCVVVMAARMMDGVTIEVVEDER